jgi:hypothetical protein
MSRKVRGMISMYDETILREGQYHPPLTDSLSYMKRNDGNPPTLSIARAWFGFE